MKKEKKIKSMCKGILVPPYTYPQHGLSHSCSSLPPGACGHDTGAVPPTRFDDAVLPIVGSPVVVAFRAPPPLHTRLCVSSPVPKQAFLSLISGAVYNAPKTPAVRAPVPWQALRLAARGRVV